MPFTSTVRLSPLALPALFMACGGGQATGDLAAERTGQILVDLAPRDTTDEELAACGQGAPLLEFSDRLERTPFLQQVRGDAAKVVFRGQLEGETLEVADTNGETVLSVEPERDPQDPAGQQWIANLKGLQPNMVYCYSLPGMTAPVGFRTAPGPGMDQKVRFVVFGDSGSGNGDQYALLDQLQTVSFDFVLHTGDIAYESGTEAEFNNRFFDVYAPLIRSFPVFPASGNHDYGKDAAAYLRSFVLPDNGGAERWYSFDWGDIHFVVLDTERIGAQQAQWLDADLEKTTLPWKIVIAHKPPFSSGWHGSDRGVRHDFVPILERHQVNLVLSGHDHNYERTVPMNGVTYVVTGAGGRGTREVGHSSFTAFAEAVIHFVYVEVDGQRLVLHAIDGVGREFDQGVIELE